MKRGKQEIANDIEDIRQTLEALSQFRPNKIYTREEIINDIAKIIAMSGGEIKIIYKSEQKMQELSAKHSELHDLLQYGSIANNEEMPTKGQMVSGSS